MKSLPTSQGTPALERFHSARRTARSDTAFRNGIAGVWHCLRAARSESDALILFRGAQLAHLEQRMHLAMEADPWSAAEAARAHVTAQADQLLAYVDPLVAAIGAIALQTGFSARTLPTVTTQHARYRIVPSLAGFDAGEMDPSIAALVSPQASAASRSPGRNESLPLLVRARSGEGRVNRRGAPEATAVVTEDRVTAVLRALEIERDLIFGHDHWADEHGITVAQL